MEFDNWKLVPWQAEREATSPDSERTQQEFGTRPSLADITLSSFDHLESS